MDDRPQIALYWCAGCGGCEESVIDMAGDLIALADRARIAFWPIALDYRRDDLERLDDGRLLVSLINGAVRTDEQADMARLLRRKSRIVMAHGACAHLGGVVGLANFFTREALMEHAYRDVPSVDNPEGILPGAACDPHLPPLARLDARVRPLDRVIEVDYTVPGCPPTPALVKKALLSALDGNLPAAGSVLAGTDTVCDTCPRRDSRPDPGEIGPFKRLQETLWDPDRCFLGQRLVCLGPVTRGGCEARCLAANMPCRGCFGPARGIRDQGARALAYLSALVAPAGTGADPQRPLGIPDPAGLFYRYSLAASVLGGRAKESTS